MKKIKIQGTEYPVRLTIGAMVQYKRETGEDFSQFKGDDMEKLGIVVFHAIRSACKAEGTSFPYNSPEEIIDHIDMEQAVSLLGVGASTDTGTEAKKTDGWRHNPALRWDRSECRFPKSLIWISKSSGLSIRHGWNIMRHFTGTVGNRPVSLRNAC